MKKIRQKEETKTQKRDHKEKQIWWVEVTSLPVCWFSLPDANKFKDCNLEFTL
jgi:hypothetical protein